MLMMKASFLLLVLQSLEAFTPLRSKRRKAIVTSLSVSGRVNGSQSQSSFSIKDSYNLVVLGDLHMEDDMTNHEEARSDCIKAVQKLSLMPTTGSSSTSETEITAAQMVQKLGDVSIGNLNVEELELFLEYKKHGKSMKSHLVSLGDLGRKDIRHEPGDAGTTKSFEMAKEYFDEFNLVSLDLVSGNHDLEGLDEFDNDQDNLNAWMKCFDKPTPQFSRYIGEKTLLLGLSTTRFRSAPYSSHEVHVSDEQIEWFQDMVEQHPHEDGWKIFVFSHAPIMGSGLRVLQNVHVVNGCAWLNHCSENRNCFIRCVKDNPQIKLWFSGHFHLSHDYEDAISRVGSCTFVQAGVVGEVSTRDGRRQTRIIHGNDKKIKIYTINHHKRDKNNEAELRLDAEVNLNEDVLSRAHGSEDYDHENWFSAYVPQEEDGCYLEMPKGQVACSQTVQKSVCWWHMADGAVLGLHEGHLVEYDAETLCPLGIVIPDKKLEGREVLVVEEGTAVVLVDQETKDIEVVHPNDDGSYWRKFQRNKKIRQEEKLREKLAKQWLATQ